MKRDNQGRFVKGATPWNKGQQMCSKQWTGGKTKDKRGYILVTVGYKDNGTAIYQEEHRIVMENHLGRKLLSSEWVHHLNDNKGDNRLENLELITSQKHNNIHKSWLKRKWRPCRRAKNAACLHSR